MTFSAFYKKYRPLLFKHVIGQETNIRILQNMLMKNNLHHALLFAGSHGSGKTSVARILAKAINCPARTNNEPCDQCHNCLLFQGAKKPLDIFEIDGASNNGVDEIRRLKENIQLLPLNLTYKVYIIDEVHMLSISAFNALLKILEEPPKHILFIFATTELHKLPATFMSRCQQYDFKKIATANIYKKLTQIVQLEAILITETAVQEIAVLSDGSLRDALNMLEKAANFKDKVETVTLQDIANLFSAISTAKKKSFLMSVFNQEFLEVFHFLDEIFRENVNLKLFFQDLSNIIHEILIQKILKQHEVATTGLAAVTITDLKTFLKGLFPLLEHSSKQHSKAAVSVSFITIIEALETKYDIKIAMPGEHTAIKAENITTFATKNNEIAITPTSAVTTNIKTTKSETVSVVAAKEHHHSLDEAINVLNGSQSHLLRKIKTRMVELQTFINDPYYGPYVRMYNDIKIVAVSSDAILISCETDDQVNLINAQQEQLEHCLFVQKVYGNYFFIAIQKEKINDLKQTYHDMKHQNQLQPYQKISLPACFYNQEREPETDVTLEFLKNTFTDVQEEL